MCGLELKCVSAWVSFVSPGKLCLRFPVQSCFPKLPRVAACFTRTQSKHPHHFRHPHPFTHLSRCCQVYEDCKMVTLNAPYVAGFLGFREAPPLLQALERLKSEQPNLMPQVLFVDGNGLFHYREFGLACHLGVLLELPCVGVAKNLLYVEGVVRSEGHQSQVGESSAYCRCNGIISGAVVAINTLQKSGDSFPLATASGKVLGKALRSSQRSTKPVYVSVGHRISLDTAVKLTHTCCLYRVPEPIRQELNEEHQLDCENSSPFQADLLSNKVLIPLNILRICVCVYMCVCSDYTLV
ncbi:endonuclease V-like isoform X3 [Myxocyprinus asiaticus]|uniref:endonuclease V-like isoform X3 n=1 Tax=Myxocyprinus asiaticus TaxID=70543 RepID=UPI002221C58C|nr:endonuclease V-like isoform X3 [Myxocyprinus asiaticus]